MSSARVVTIFDSNYASLGFSMIESAVKHINADIIFDIYPLDDFKESLEKFCESRQIKYRYNDSFFGKDSILLRKKSRDYSNFIFSLTPSILKESLKQKDTDYLIYLDADTFFFNKIDMEFLKNLKNPIHLIPHQFDEKNKHLLKFGRINVGWMSFKTSSEETMKFLDWWEKKCIESTETSQESLKKGIFGDQLYLDNAVNLFDLEELMFSKINVAPWNFRSYSNKDKNFIVKMYHFHHLYRDNKNYYLPTIYYKRLTSKKEKSLYLDYLKKVNQLQNEFCLNTSLSNKRRSSSFIKKLVLYFFRETIPVSKFES